MIPIEDLEKAIAEDKLGVLIRLKLKPGASTNRLIDVQEDRLRVSVKEPATEGKANKALISFLAKQLSLSKSSVTLVKGESSRLKVVRVQSSKDIVLERLSRSNP